MELQAALELSNLSFSLSICAQMIRVFGKVRDGNIVPNEFVSLHKNLQATINNFKAHDTESKGKLRLDQARAAIAAVGYTLDDVSELEMCYFSLALDYIHHFIPQTAFYTCCKSFDPDRTGDMGIPEFIAMNLFLVSARNTFTAFDFQKLGQVHLNFGQFVYAAANCR